jgi:hypothetical protein
MVPVVAVPVVELVTPWLPVEPVVAVEPFDVEPVVVGPGDVVAVLPAWTRRKDETFTAP